MTCQYCYQEAVLYTGMPPVPVCAYHFDRSFGSAMQIAMRILGLLYGWQCAGCGCTDANPCVSAGGDPCHWEVASTAPGGPLCSRCARGKRLVEEAATTDPGEGVTYYEAPDASVPDGGWTEESLRELARRHVEAWRRTRALGYGSYRFGACLSRVQASCVCAELLRLAGRGQGTEVFIVPVDPSANKWVVELLRFPADIPGIR